MQATPNRVVACALVSLAGVLVGGGCAGKGQLAEGADYPAQIKQVRTIDVQVTRNETEISLTNTTAAPLPAGTMWINAWYAREFPGLAVGESVTLNLRDFRDRFGDVFRAGGFWATDRPDRLALAQLEAGGELLGLIVVTPGGL